MIMAWIAIKRSLWASGALRKLDGLKVFLSSKIEDDEMRKTAICSIRFAECALLLEAAALNYTVDYYHNCATGVIVPRSSPSHTQIVFFCNAACWSEDKKLLYLRVKLTLQLYKDTQAIHIRIGACWTQSEFAGRSSLLIDCFLSLERQRERKREKQMERRRGGGGRMWEREREREKRNLMKCKDYAPDSTVGSGSSSQVCSLLRRLPHTT